MVKEEELINIITTEEVDETMVTRQVQEVPVSLLPGIFKADPDLDPATVIQGNKNLCFVFTVAKTIANKKSVLQELKTNHLVSNRMENRIFPSSKTTDNSPMSQVMRVRANCTN